MAALAAFWRSDVPLFASGLKNCAKWRTVRNGRDSRMTERLTGEAVNGPETVIMRAARLAYRLGRQDQQRMLERALRKYFGDDEPANILRDLAVGLPHEPVSFQAIVWGREVKEGKPSPQGFLLAAKKLGVAPENCVVVEDAVAGVDAAKRAGMCCVAVTNTHPEENLKEADLIVDSLEKVGVSDLEKLLTLKK